MRKLAVNKTPLKNSETNSKPISVTEINAFSQRMISEGMMKPYVSFGNNYLIKETQGCIETITVQDICILLIEDERRKMQMGSNKLFKRVAAVGLAGMMTATMALPAMAAGADATVSVTGITVGDSAKFYQVIAPDTTSTKGWKLADGFTNLTLDALLDGTIDAADAAAIVGAAGSASAKATQTSGYSYDTSGENAAGLYLVLVTPADTNTTTLYNPVFVSTDYDSSNDTNTIDISDATGTYNSGEAKMQTPTVSKTVNEAQRDVNIGDTVDFTVTTTIPAMSTYTAPKFSISDAVSAGLEIQTRTITVTGVDAANYTMDPAATTSGYTVKFNENYLKNLIASVPVTITYSAVVKSTADYNVNEMTNKASIKFSNNPTDTEGKGTDDDKTYHYTFSLDTNILGNTDNYSEEILKVAVDKNGQPITTTNKNHTETVTNVLQGAEFALYTDSSCNTPYTQNGTALTATSDQYGNISFKGLDAGNYWLKETKAPEGYVLNETAVAVVITPTYENKILKSYEVTVNGTKAAEYTLSNQGEANVTSSTNNVAAGQIKNTKANGLPSTGGIGTTIFYAFGSVLVIGAGVVMITRRRMEVQ